MQQQLVRYDAACRAVAEAKSVDEVKEISSRAEAARAYARQVKNKQLELDALEIRTRAERRLGEILLDLRKEGKIGQGRGGRPITLDDLGVDSNISAPAQRLAKMPAERFESEVSDWRQRAEVSQRLEVPLQHIRIPAAKADRIRAAARKGRRTLDASDPLAKFVSNDGRRIADWRAGELDRLAALFDRLSLCARRLREGLPLANPDPLDTMEMIFNQAALQALLADVWDREAIPSGDGLQSDAQRASRERRRRVCEHCQAEFTMDARGNTAGRFCSRECAVNHRRAQSRQH